MWSIVVVLLVCLTSTIECRCPTNVTCSQSETCCETNTGLWGCCPFTNGICCQDGIHCCPNNQICLTNGTCSNNSSSSNLLSKVIRIELTDIHCDDGSSCPDGSTCCPLASGRFGCCPIPNATCCSDHLHCCPSDHQCDVEHGRCKRKFVRTMIINEIVCPDKSSCPDGETCCRLASGDYGCCPLADAVCCSDEIHCCPHGSQCDVEHGQCIGEMSIPWFEKQPAKYRNDDDEHLFLIDDNSKMNSMIVCPDQSSMCPAKSSCCSKDDLLWKCCSWPNPTFCSDGNEICPEGFQCDLERFECQSNQFGSMKIHLAQQSNISLSKQIQKFHDKHSLKIIQCPDEKSFCPDETTCCRLIDDSFGCCPYSSGVCCADKTSCCPSGYSCDQTGRCTKHLQIDSKRNSSIPMKKLRRIDDHLCPDGVTRCSLKTTCCPNKDSNSYSCCPYTNGVCCGTNGSLCCPNNYQCDEKQLSCQLKGNNRFRSLNIDSSVHQCEDSNIFCSIDETCCPSNPFDTDQDPFACCPFKNGQCCLDGQHCCPQNARCDLMSGDCINN